MMGAETVTLFAQEGEPALRHLIFPVASLMLALTFAVTEAGMPDFETLCASQEEQAIADRRWLHEHAELSNQEHETQAFLRQALSEIPGVQLVEGEWGTGLVAMLHGARQGPLIAWRTDMDALPITEDTGLPFACKSVVTLSSGRETGVMHACGHDLHMAIALNMLRVMASQREEMSGSLLLVCQPAEEIGAGALQLLEAGLFEDGRRPDAIFAIHDHPTIPLGKVGSCPGPSSANVDAFRLTVRGCGGHGAYPHKTVDPVSLAARMVLAFEGIVTRQMDVNHPCVISVGSIHGGHKSNVIPDEVILEATVRSRDEQTRQALKAKIERVAISHAEAVGAPAPELEYQFGTASGFNDPSLVQSAREVFRRVLGEENEIIYLPPMGGEDFSFYGKEVPGFQFRVGVGRPDREMTLHRDDFDPPEEALVIGMRLACEVLWDRMHEAGEE